MRVLLIGYPVENSRSPSFQNAAFKATGQDHQYETWDLEHFEPAVVRQTLHNPSVLGANVTVPHKEAAVQVADILTDCAQRVGAVNTLAIRIVGESRPSIIGDNTDGPGFLADLDQIGVGEIRVAIVVGAGGAARAVVDGLAQRASKLVVVNRTSSRANSLISDLAPFHPTCVFSAFSFPPSPSHRDELGKAFAEADLIVDATSLGLGAPKGSQEFVGAENALRQLPVHRARIGSVFYDLKYAPSSPFLQIGEGIGARTANGLGMLVMQGALSFELWTEQPAPIEVMRKAAAVECGVPRAEKQRGRDAEE